MCDILLQKIDDTIFTHVARAHERATAIHNLEIRNSGLEYIVDALFYQRLSRILRIVIPSIRSKEALLLFMHSSLLIFRTVISLYVAGLDGK